MERGLTFIGHPLNAGCFLIFRPVRCSIPLYRWSNWGSEVFSILTKITGNNRFWSRCVWLSDIVFFPWHLNSFFYIPDKRYSNLFSNTCRGTSQISPFGLCLSEISFSCWTQIGSPHCFYPLAQVLLLVSPKHHSLNSAAPDGPSGHTPYWMTTAGTQLNLCLV